MRIGIMGLGRIGAFHTETLAGLDVVDSLVVTDPVAATVAAVTERFGATAADSPEALLAAGIDGVVIAAATDAHPELVLAAVKAGIPVFCEKPVARGVEESLEVLRAVEGSGVEVHIGYNRRFDAGFTAARRAVVSGELGALHTIRSTTLDPAPPPAAYVAASGGLFRDCTVHDFDIVRWVTGREVVEVYATRRLNIPSRSPKHGPYTELERKTGAAGTTVVSFPPPLSPVIGSRVPRHSDMPPLRPPAPAARGARRRGSPRPRDRGSRPCGARR
ncbi:Predicted dehydrogenase [Streptomyces sp. 3213]|uniref:Gfo/Idh/MocA family oxidoreductase n=1 Tax=Streptomyces sp. 3213.3 TaxID=1855348 RepID=UPI00089686CA|nr:Gfo/Idh/MocA family oxidoreductase [Streptomyces sp. 3213.3]SEC50686.1 Predicted dehydrogenase [Streptomyces sp. 3213] [Streptomyces sp. 3213.3]